MNMHVELILIAVVTAIACALPGIFLVLRGMALMSDAISHAILPGIVLMFLWVQQLHSPLLIVGAALSGLLLVMVAEYIIAHHNVQKEATVGLLYPLFFSVGVLLVSWCTRNTHLDSDMVFLGELAFAPFYRMTVLGHDVGPVALWVMGSILVCNAIMLRLFYKEFQVSIFDPLYAQVIGFSPLALHYVLMTATSVTAVGAFDVMGSMVVVALMIVPPAAAYCVTRTVSKMIACTLLISCLSVVGGYALAHTFDVSIAGSIAVMSGFVFALAVMSDRKVWNFFLEKRC